MILKVFYNEYLKIIWNPYSKIIPFLIIISAVGMFAYFYFMSLEGYERIVKHEPLFSDPNKFHFVQWKAFTTIGIVPIHAYLVWIVFGAESRNNGWLALIKLPIPLRNVTIIKFSCLFICKALVFLVMAGFFILNTELLTGLREDVGYTHFSITKDFSVYLLKVYLASMGSFLILFPLMTFVDNLGVLIFLPLILSSIPIKINPVTLFVETEINWLLGLAYLFLSVLYTIYVFIPNKLKNVA